MQGVQQSQATGKQGTHRHEEIYRSISDAIIEHRLKPGARLRAERKFLYIYKGVIA